MERQLPIQPDRSSPALEAGIAMSTSDAIIEISADAIISIDEDQRVIRYNRGAAEIFGYTAEEMLGQHIDVLIPSRFRPNHGAQIEGFARSPTVARRMGERRQISGLRKNGEEFPAEASISKTRIADRWIFTVALRDVTERVRAQLAQEFLAQATGILNTSLDPDSILSSIASLSLPLLADWCVVFLGDGREPYRRALAVHSAADRQTEMAALTELPFEPRAGHPVEVSMNNGEAILIADFDDDVLRSWADGPEHERVLRALAPASVIVAPLHARGRQIGALTFFRDARNARRHDAEDLEVARELARRAGMAMDNARLYEVAQHAVQARDDVLAVVSHDLGNPLAAIRLSAKVLARQAERRKAAGSADETLAEQAENIRASVDQMDRLIKDLLDIRRIESGFLALDRERLSADSLMREVYESYAALAAVRGIQLSINLAAGNAEIVADHPRMLQVFSNLLGNALKFTPPGQAVSIGAHRVPGDGIRFHVSDTGAGIPREHLPHIFDRFWQARRTGRHSIGLGLAIVKGIVDAHGGSITVESELGVGTTFAVTMPAAE